MRVCVDCGKPVAPPFDPNRVTRCPTHQQEYIQHNRPLQRAAWRKLRLTVLQRDGWKCRDCGEPAKQVHHLDPRESGGALLASTDRLISLCGGCHLKRTPSAGRYRDSPQRTWIATVPPQSQPRARQPRAFLFGEDGPLVG